MTCSMYITKFTGLNCTWLIQSSETNHPDTVFCYRDYTSTSTVIKQDSFWKVTDASRMCEVPTLTIEHLDFGSTYIYI